MGEQAQADARLFQGARAFAADDPQAVEAFAELVIAHKPMNTIEKWFYADAEWWQFWMPQSGAIGGAIFGAALGLVAGFAF